MKVNKIIHKYNNIYTLYFTNLSYKHINWYDVIKINNYYFRVETTCILLTKNIYSINLSYLFYFVNDDIIDNIKINDKIIKTKYKIMSFNDFKKVKKQIKRIKILNKFK